jgi:hypothetical protein
MAEELGPRLRSATATPTEATGSGQPTRVGPRFREAHAKGAAVEDRAAPYALAAGETRRDDAILVT